MSDNRVQITDELRAEIEEINSSVLNKLLFIYDSMVRQSIARVTDSSILMRMLASAASSDFDLSERVLEIEVFLRKSINFKPVPPMQPGTPEYAEYIQSEAWQQQRTYALDRAKNRCQLCNSPYRLQAHHRTYERLGKEEPEDLTVLCDECHRTFHKYRTLYKGGE